MHRFALLPDRRRAARRERAVAEPRQAGEEDDREHLEPVLLDEIDRVFAVPDREVRLDREASEAPEPDREDEPPDLEAEGARREVEDLEGERRRQERRDRDREQVVG